MAFGISQSVRSREVQACTPVLFHQATQSGRVKDVCAQIEDALERKRRGEICPEDYETMKTRLKAQLPILTPHATFKNGRRVNADAIPSGLSIYDKDHIPDPRGYWESKREVLSVTPMPGNHHGDRKTVLDCVVLAHVTPSTEGLRLVFVIPDGMDLATAQRWMSEQLEDPEYDSCVKDLARPSYIVPEEYILYLNEDELFKERTFTNTNPTNVDNNNQKNQDNDNNDNRLSGGSGNSAVPAGAAAEHAQPADNNAADTPHLGHHGGGEDGDGQVVFPTEYDGIPYETLTAKLVELLGDS